MKMSDDDDDSGDNIKNKEVDLEWGVLGKYVDQTMMSTMITMVDWMSCHCYHNYHDQDD